jgi:hypothetical protein
MAACSAAASLAASHSIDHTTQPNPCQFTRILKEPAVWLVSYNQMVQTCPATCCMRPVARCPHPNHNSTQEPPLQLLKRPLAEFSATRKEWVYKVAKAVGQGFAATAAGGSVGVGGQHVLGVLRPHSVQHVGSIQYECAFVLLPSHRVG